MQRIIEESGITTDMSFVKESKDACIEMETGIGKTLTYLQFVYELFGVL